VKKSGLILLGILAVFTVACLLLPDAFTATLRKEVMVVLGPFLRTADTPVAFFRGMNSKLKTLDQAQAEVIRLRQQVAALTVQNQLLADKSAENARLREMIGFRDASPYKLRPCRVVTREPSNWWTTVQVNVGWEDDPALAKDQPVVSPRGVVGKTGNVSRNITDVILLVDPNCKITAVVDGTHDQCIVEGHGNFEESRPQIDVTDLPKSSQVAVGQFVVDVPPVSKSYPTFGLYREAHLEPTADLNNLDELFIVIGPKQQTDSPAASTGGSSGGQ
jgi:rod shape-determining protein MreC